MEYKVLSELFVPVSLPKAGVLSLNGARSFFTAKILCNVYICKTKTVQSTFLLEN